MEHCYVIPEKIEAGNHPIDHSNYHRSSISSPKIYQCNLCGCSYKHNASLYKHLKRVHHVKVERENMRCLEEGCGDFFTYVHNFRDHLVAKHGLTMEFENLQFLDMNSFLGWKKQIEEESNVRFVKDTGGKKNWKETNYYRCNRTGYYVDKSKKIENKRQRKLKSQGSAKINNHCTATIVVKKSWNDVILVKFFKTHYGHDIDPAFLSLNTREKKKNRGKLKRMPKNDFVVDCDSVPDVEALVSCDLSDLEDRKENLVIKVQSLLEEVKNTDDSDLLNEILVHIEAIEQFMLDKSKKAKVEETDEGTRNFKLEDVSQNSNVTTDEMCQKMKLETESNFQAVLVQVQDDWAFM